MAKKWIIAVVSLLLAFTAGYFIYNTNNKVHQTKNEKPQPPTGEINGIDRNKPPELSPEKQAIIKAVVSRMTSVMESKNAKKIRDFTSSLYENESEKASVSKLTDSQILKSADFYKELKLGDSISTALSYLPDSAWKISSTTATITQQGEAGHKITFTASKINGVWQ